MAANADEIISSIKKKIYEPVYLLEGDEPFYIDQVCNCIEHNLLPESERSFNQIIVYGKEITARQLNEMCRRYPMFGNYQLVIVKEAQEIKDWENLSTYLEKPLKSTILVICYKYKTFDKRTAVYKKLKECAEILTTKKMYDNKLPEFILGQAASMKRKIDLHAAALMAEYIGNDLSRLISELEKLCIVISAEKTISLDDIEKNIGLSKEYNVFELNHALGTKDVKKANRIINYFASNSKNNPFVLTIGSIYSYFCKMMLYHSQKGAGDKELAAVLGVNPFFVKDYKSAAQHYSPAKLQRIISDLHDYDLRSKGMNNAHTSTHALLRELVYKILH